MHTRKIHPLTQAFSNVVVNCCSCSISVVKRKQCLKWHTKPELHLNKNLLRDCVLYILKVDSYDSSVMTILRVFGMVMEMME